jgi:diacylglycerol kinase (ATP)
MVRIMVAKVILNPYSGRWKALQRRPEAEAALRATGVAFDLVLTDAPGRGIDLAAQAARAGFGPLIAAGGDGCISEVVNGLMLAAHDMGAEALPLLGILPLGSANDLALNLRLPRALPEAARVIAAGRSRRQDVGQALLDGRVRYFDNNAALGLEPTITLIQQGITRLRGALRYVLAALIGIARKPEWVMQLEWEGGEYHGPVTLVTVGIHPITGGVFHMAPHAAPADGRLTFVYGYTATRRQLLQLLPRAMKPGAGNYVEHPAVHEVHTTWLRVTSEQPSPLHADGEIQSQAARRVEFQCLPGQIEVLVDENG